MRSGRGIAVAAFGCAILTHHDARAQDATLHGVFTGSIGVTDNVTSAAEPPAGPGPDADGFGTASPGLIFTYTAPRTAQTLSYTFSTSFFRHAEASSYSNVAVWSGRFVTSPRTSLTLGASGSQGQLNTFQLEQTPGTTTLQGTAGGTTNFVQGSFNEGSRSSPRRSGRSGRRRRSPSTTRSWIARSARTASTNTLNANRSFRHDVAALALSVGYTHFDNVPVTDTDPATEDTYTSRDQLLSTLVASWQHDLGRRFSSQVDVGGVVATDLAGGAGSLARPTGLAALRYLHERGDAAELAYTYAATPNVFLQQIQLSHMLTLRAAVPVHAAWHLSVEGSASAQLAQPLETNAEGDLDTGPTTLAVLTDVGLLYSPVIVIPDFALALRYQHANQRTEREDGGAPRHARRPEHAPPVRVGRVPAADGAGLAHLDDPALRLCRPFRHAAPGADAERAAGGRGAGVCWRGRRRSLSAIGRGRAPPLPAAPPGCRERRAQVRRARRKAPVVLGQLVAAELLEHVRRACRRSSATGRPALVAQSLAKPVPSACRPSICFDELRSSVSPSVYIASTSPGASTLWCASHRRRADPERRVDGRLEVPQSAAAVATSAGGGGPR